MKKKKNKETKKKGRGTKDGKYLFMDKNLHGKKNGREIPPLQPLVSFDVIACCPYHENMSIEVISNSQNTEAPFSQEFIINFIKENVDVPSKHLITNLADCLKEKSSMHKFFVQSTSLQNKDDLNDLQIQSDFAALWDTKKDGCLSIQYGMNNEILIITIYWISI